MKTFVFLLFQILILQAAAQRACVTQPYTQNIRADKMVAARMDAADAFASHQVHNFLTGTATATSTQNRPSLIRIPVVVHLLYNTPAQNISDAEIKSGLDALNRDFRRQNSDSVNTPDRFKAIAADVGIEFDLAAADPLGRATTGVVRKHTTLRYFEMDDKIKWSAQGGDDAWDSKLYFNIWLGDLRQLLGYGTMPGGDAALDGVVINIAAFGTTTSIPPYNLGRTVVHETGHWLGLHHVWGDASCGDDLVDDTPQQGGYTSGCPKGFRTSCNNAPDGDMYMNYMDFTNDACMNLFTMGQKARMRAQFEAGGARYSLLTSTGLNPPWAEAAPLAEEDSISQTTFQVYPNPATSIVTLQCAVPALWPASTLSLVNATGGLIKKINLTARTQTLSLARLQSGVYFLYGFINGMKIHQKLVKL